MRTAFLIFCSAATLSAQPAAGQKPEVRLATSKASAEDLVHGRIPQLFARFNDGAKQRLPETVLSSTIGMGLKQLGAFKTFQGEATRQNSGVNDLYLHAAEFENGIVDVSIVIDPDGKVAGVAARPRPVKPPPATSPVKEEEVVIKTGEFEMPGTISWPAGAGPFPAVVIVHGSGPQDRDSTTGPNTPYRDLAWGLAQQGVAVLRYDKRTKKYGAKSFAGKVSIKDEVVDDALNAVALLRANARINPNRIVLAGHSLGGQVAPYMAEKDGKLAGVLILAGPGRPITDLVIAQTKYMIKLNPEVKSLETQLAEVEKLKKITPDMEDKRTLGAPNYYWKELDSFNAPETAKKLALPIMVVQGERDYQVTMADFAAWKSAIGEKTNAVLKSYPKLNHLFLEGSGTPTPAEYMKLGHVPEYVISDISKWVNGLPAHGR